MDNPEKLATQRIYKTERKRNTMCVRHHYAQTNTVAEFSLPVLDSMVKYQLITVLYLKLLVL